MQIKYDMIRTLPNLDDSFPIKLKLSMLNVLNIFTLSDHFKGKHGINYL